MVHQQIKQKICGKHGVSTKEPSCDACLNLFKEEVKEERSFDSIKDYSRKNILNSNNPNELTILKKAREKISKCSLANLIASKRLENTANARVSS